MLVQIYEVSSPEEARALCAFGVDHIVLVGNGTFPREQSVEKARDIFEPVSALAKSSALCLSADLELIRKVAAELSPSILHLGASTDLLSPSESGTIKSEFPSIQIMRSIPVVGHESVALAETYDGIADMLLLDSHNPGDKQIGGLGKTHDWDLDRRIVENVSIPVLLAGGLGVEKCRRCNQSCASCRR
jgi:phosphoribosylanthranilate isomerase